jgi:hypothetical protein
MLGAFAEFDRAKITERMTRGRLHRLRMGELSSTGHRIYGYHYVKKTPDAPAWLVINEEQAAIVRSIFEMFASGNYGILNISRFIERFRPARDGRNGTEARSSSCSKTKRMRDAILQRNNRRHRREPHQQHLCRFSNVSGTRA